MNRLICCREATEKIGMSVSTSHEYMFDLINIRQCHGSVEQQEHASHEGLPSMGDGSAGRWASHRDDEP